MKLDDLRNQIDSLVTHVLFDYNGKQCGVDPFSHTHFAMWYGDEDYTASSIDDVMSVPLFDGKSLTEIYEDIENIDW